MMLLCLFDRLVCDISDEKNVMQQKTYETDHINAGTTCARARTSQMHVTLSTPGYKPKESRGKIETSKQRQ